MQMLKRVFLSQNNLSSLENGDLNVVPALKEVSMDHNQLSTVDKDALKVSYVPGASLFIYGLFQNS